MSQNNPNLFIHPQNQTLLWNIICNIPNFNKLGDGSISYKQEWFKMIIEKIYTENPGNVYDAGSLAILNKKTVVYAKQILSNDVATPSQPSMSSASYTNEAERERKLNTFNQSFQDRQNEYNRFLEKPKPPTEINFSEKLDDQPISNMEELVERHKREREKELNIQPLIQSSPSPSSNRIKITDEPATMPIKEIVPLSVSDSISSKKVSWASNTDKDYDSIASLKIKYNMLEQKYMDLSKQINELREQMKSNSTNNYTIMQS